jgi:hypothetical protein
MTLASQTITTLAAESGERHLPMPPVAFGILALVGFIVLLGITFAFRSSGTKH